MNSQQSLDLLLRQNSAFRWLDDASRAELVRRARSRSLDKGAVLCHQGEVWTRAALLVAGTAQWSLVSPSGRRQVIFRLHAVSMVWGHSMFDDQPMPATLEMVTPARVYWWPREALMPLLLRRAEAVWAVAQDMVDWMRRVREVVYDLAFHPVTQRVARLLLEQYPAREGRPIPRHLTLDEMAAMVGTSRELVSRVLQRLAREGILQVHHRYLIFLDRHRLEQWAYDD